MPRRPPAKNSSSELSRGSILRVKIRLLDVSPMVWRRLLVPAAFTLEELHGVLQVAMGWEGIHLYRFRIHAVHYGSFELAAFIHQGGERSGCRVEMINVGLHRRASLAAALTAA